MKNEKIESFLQISIGVLTKSLISSGIMDENEYIYKIEASYDDGISLIIRENKNAQNSKIHD
jgi:hypothetical protein